MRVKLPVAMLAGLLLAAPGFAQTTTTTDPGTGQPVAMQPSPAPSPDTERDLDSLPNEFIIGGFVGGSFARNALQTAVDFGANFDYLHNGAFGVEFLAGFAPKFKLDRLAGNDSDVNNYMANVIAAVPVGAFHAVRPFISAGVGALTLSQNTTTSNNAVVNATSALFQPSETHFGGDIGGGIMAFTGAYGIRADVRYFSSLGHKNANSAAGAVPGTLLSVLDNTSFWRANVGFSFRF
jgi:hypothetical protein